jgi:hypothetical protein
LFVVPILLYVALDLSLPAMPGAFVFDARDSVESTKESRGRGTSDIMGLVTSAPEPVAVSKPRVAVASLSIAPAEAAARRRSVVIWRPRTRLDSPPPSLDPH